MLKRWLEIVKTPRLSRGMLKMSLQLRAPGREDRSVHIGEFLGHTDMEELIEFLASRMIFSLVFPHIRWVEIAFINTRNMFGDKQVVFGEEHQVFFMDFVMLYGMHNIS